ncbi:helix-turn-helix domain-containing protein [Virgibacillus kimchii]
MELDFFWLAAGLAGFGYFIGDGLKNFKNPNAWDVLESDDSLVLIKEKDIHHFLGISKEDTVSLIKDYPDIPHMKINNHIYFPKAKLREWMKREMK